MIFPSFGLRMMSLSIRAGTHTHQFDPTLNNWKPLRPAFPGAMWPMRRVFHISTSYSMFHSAATVPVVRDYIATARAWAKSYIYQFRCAKEPTHGTSNSTIIFALQQHVFPKFGSSFSDTAMFVRGKY